MPNERFRAICLGGSLLRQMQVDASVPAGVHARAKEIVQHYPSDVALREFLERDRTVVLPESWANAIEDARVLFQELRESNGGNAETKHQLLYTMRHYPLRGEAARLKGREAGPGPWLEPD